MSLKGRVITLVVVIAVVAVTTVAYLAWSTSTDPSSSADSAGRAPLQVPADQIGDEPRILFRNTVTGPGYGRVAMVALDDAGGARAVTATKCDRVAHQGEATLCLRARTGIVSAYQTSVTQGGDSKPYLVDRPGIPSRARLSPSGALAATTAFVAGDSYLAAGFSTRTYITSLASRKVLHVEDFALIHQGKKIAPVERNYWGVTFVDDDVFYVTVSFAGDTWLARGSIFARSIETIHRSAECPSVSPDHTRVAYKKRVKAGGWRLVVLDLASGSETMLPERRSVDDQVEWLDDSTLLYSLPLTGARSGQSNVWSMSADGNSAPTLLIKQAASPSVVH